MGKNSGEHKVIERKQTKADYFYVLDKAGHCANMDNPQLFNDILMRFIVKAE